MQQIHRASSSADGQLQFRFLFGNERLAVVPDNERDCTDTVRSGRKHVEIEEIPGRRGNIHRSRFQRAKFEIECNMAFPHDSLPRRGGETDGENVDPLAAVLNVGVEIARHDILKAVGLLNRYSARRTVRTKDHLPGQLRNQLLFSVNQNPLQRQRH